MDNAHVSLVRDQLPSWAIRDINDDKMTTVALRIDPALAVKWLEGNTHNRPLGGKLVEEFKEAIQAGKWKLTHEGIAFDPGGVLIDGQHRLWAIVEAAKAVKMMVTFNEPAENREYINIGKNRSPVDRMQLAGYTWIKPIHTGICLMLANDRKSKLRTDEMKVLIDLYAEGLQTVVSSISGGFLRGVTNATVMAPCVRAYYKKGVDRARLIEFIEVLCTGQGSGPADSSAILLRNLLLRQHNARSHEGRDVVYRRTENALKFFLDREPLKILKVVDHELFPLPHDKPVAKAKAKKAVKP